MNLDSNVVIDIDDINVADKNSCLIIPSDDLSPKLLSWINILIYGLEGCRFIIAMHCVRTTTIVSHHQIL